MPPFLPDDLRAVSEACTSFLMPLAGRDWRTHTREVPASARAVLNHMANVVCWYATSLATEARGRMPWPRGDDPDSSETELVEVVAGLAATLAAVASAMAEGARAYHPSGTADRAGFLAMGSDELLIHTWDIGTAFGLEFEPPAGLAAPVLRRLFPDIPFAESAWPALLWANGRISLPGRPRERVWRWHSAPLGESPETGA